MATLHLFPQVAVGSASPANFHTDYFIVNPSAQTANIQVDFFGDDGLPLSVALSDRARGGNLGTGSSFTLTIPPGGSGGVGAEADDALRQAGGVKTGWARITSSVAIGVLSSFEIGTRISGSTPSGPVSLPLRTSVGVPPSTALQQFHLFSIRIVSGSNTNLDVGVAMANPSDTPATITVTFFNLNGVQVDQRTFTLGPKAHLARFASELSTVLGTSFAGRAVITSSVPIIVMSLYSDLGQLTSYPVFQ